jgi:hypothetical protein
VALSEIREGCAECYIAQATPKQDDSDKNTKVGGEMLAIRLPSASPPGHTWQRDVHKCNVLAGHKPPWAENDTVADGLEPLTTSQGASIQ